MVNLYQGRTIIAGRTSTVDNRLKTTETQGKFYYVFNFLDFFNFFNLEMFFSTTDHRLPIIDSCFNDSTIQQFNDSTIFDHRLPIFDSTLQRFNKKNKHLLSGRA